MATMQSTKLLPLEFRVFRRLEALKASGVLESAKILVACSGGLDSVALASCLSRISKRLNFQMVIGHVYHGHSKSPNVVRARIAAFRKSREIARILNVPFMAAKPSDRSLELTSEESLRMHRLKSLEWIRAKTMCTHIAFAHHRDDLFETRLIRLLRGTGPQGLSAMQELNGEKLRPFLGESREEILRYAQNRKLTWVEDPTNADTEYLRNWLRHVWLPQLEEKRPGASRAFARSVEILVENLADNVTENLRGSHGATPETPLETETPKTFDRKRYAGLGSVEKRQALAAFLLAQGAREFSSRHIDEIQKRLQTTRRQFSFRLLKMDWDINAEQVSVRRASRTT
jgi:tRNA(Ile)-lysidine synthase